MKDNIKVSVLTPLYNHNINYVRECLESLKAQEISEAEFILIDNEANSETKEIINEYVNKDERFKTIRIEKNGGYGKAMNLGLKEAQGEYIGIVESDDKVHPEMFKELYTLAERNNADIVKSLFSKFEDNNKNIEKPAITFEDKVYYKKLKPMNVPDFCNKYGGYWSAIYKRDFLLKNDIWYDEMPKPSAEDIMFTLKTFCLAQSLVITDKVYYYHRMDNPNSSIHKKNQIVWDCLALYKKLDEFFKSKGEQISESAWKIKNHREYMNLYLHMIGKNLTKNRLKFLLEISSRFRNMLRNNLIEMSSGEMYLINEIAYHPLRYYFLIKNGKTKIKDGARITKWLGGILKFKMTDDNKKWYFCGIQFSCKKHSLGKVVEPKINKNYDNVLFNKIFTAWRRGNEKCILNEYEMIYNNNNYWERGNNKIWLVFMIELLKQNREDEARMLLRRYVNTVGYLDIAKFLPVADFAYKNGFYTPDIKKASYVFAKLEENKNRNLFENYIKGKSVAIVGNSGGELGKNKGSEIDSHDVVIRFNNYPDNFVDDYGQKTNIWLHGVGAYQNDIRDDRDLSKIDLVVWYYDIWNADLRFNHLDVLYENLINYPDKIVCITSKYNHELSVNYDIPFPSSGALTIYSIIKDGKCSYADVYGFSFLEDNPSFTHYFDNVSRLDADHDMSPEMNMLKEVYSSYKNRPVSLQV